MKKISWENRLQSDLTINPLRYSDNMYDPNSVKAEANQRSLLKIVDGGHMLADHSFDHMSHNSKDSPKNAYQSVSRDLVSESIDYWTIWITLITILIAEILWRNEY